MSYAEAIRTLQHASEYIFCSQIAASSRKTMRGKTELWQAMATLDECRNLLQQEDSEKLQRGVRNQSARLTLVCGLSA